jgi:phage terminase large subunit-like protein
MLNTSMFKTLASIREACEADLFTFARVLNSNYMYGDIHEEVFSWLSDPNANERQLLLLPRGHLKSHCIATFCAWEITRHPWITMVYLASQEDLGKAQLHAIKQIMTSDTYSQLWPEMLSEESGVKGERGAWSAFAFDVDHPERKKRKIRDHTVIVKTVKSNAQGLHCDGLLYDDVVVPVFAATQTGRTELSRSLGYFNSILNPGGWIKAAGTRYDPADAYQSMIDASYPIWDEVKGEEVGSVKLWDVLEKTVEDSIDRSGRGKYLWPRTESPDTGESYGFDANTLAKIKASYVAHEGLVNFYSQYYNDPNSPGTERISRDKFQYYDGNHIRLVEGRVQYNRQPLRVFCAMDVAWTDTVSSDYTAIAVIGIDSDGYIYILDLDRFKTTDFLEYYQRIQQLQDRWCFRRMLVETNAGGYLVAQEIEKFIRRNGGSLVVDRRPATSRLGSKEERWASVLEPRYESKSVFHKRGGLTAVLEEELIAARPRNDDLKDALCSAISIAVPPPNRQYVDFGENTNIVAGKFGGRVRIR